MVNDRDADYEYRGWRIKVEASHVGNAYSGHADLYRKGQHKCRVVLTTSRLDEATARSALHKKACDFIDDWMTDHETGGSNFADL